MERCGAVVFALAFRLAELFNKAREGERERGTGKSVHDFFLQELESAMFWTIGCGFVLCFLGASFF